MITRRVVTGPGYVPQRTWGGPREAGTVAHSMDEAPHSGSGLAAERARRQAQVDALRAGGEEPYPYRFDRSHTVAEVRAGWGQLDPGTETADDVTVAGRILLKRDTG